jgi:hypothetical protein
MFQYACKCQDLLKISLARIYEHLKMIKFLVPSKCVLTPKDNSDNKSEWKSLHMHISILRSLINNTYLCHEKHTQHHEVYLQL